MRPHRSISQLTLRSASYDDWGFGMPADSCGVDVASVTRPRPALVAPPPRRETAPSAGGISPVWFWVGTGVTAVLAGAAIASGFDTNAKHDDFVAHPNTDTQAAGISARTRTNILAGATAAAGAVTAGVGLFGVRWGSASSTASVTRSIDFTVGAASLSIRGHY